MSEFGIDYIEATTPDYQIDSLIKQWNYKGHSMAEPDLPFGQAKNGQLLTGKGYYLNRGKDTEYPCSLDINSQGLKIQFNPSTLLHDYSLTTDIEPAFKAIEKHLQHLGIETELQRMKLKRVDLAKNAVLADPIETYIGAMTMLKGKRMKGVKYPTGYEFGNGQRQAIMYSKHIQMESKGVKTPPNLTRLEPRFKHKAISKRSTGVGCYYLSDIMNKGSKALETDYNRFVLSQVFRTDKGEQLAFNWGTEVELLKTLKERHSRGAISRYFAFDGVSIALERVGGLDTFRRLLMDAGWTRESAYRIMDNARQMMHQKAFVDIGRNEKTIATTIDELKNAFAS